MKKPNRKGMTIVEVLFVILMTSMIFLTTGYLLRTSTQAIFYTVDSNQNRIVNYENVYIITREVQSCDNFIIKSESEVLSEIDEEGKGIIISYKDGKDNIEYTIKDNNLFMNGIKLNRINSEKSYFKKLSDNLVEIRLVTLKHETEKGVREKVYTFKVTKRVM